MACVTSDEPVTLTTFLSEQAEVPEESSTLLLNEKENDTKMANEFDSSSDEEVEGEDAKGENLLLQGEIKSYFALIISQHVNGCYTFCLFRLNRKLPELLFINKLLIVISK